MRTPVNVILTAMACCDTVVLFSNLVYTTHYSLETSPVPRTNCGHEKCSKPFSSRKIRLKCHTDKIWSPRQSIVIVLLSEASALPKNYQRKTYEKGSILNWWLLRYELDGFLFAFSGCLLFEVTSNQYYGFEVKKRRSYTKKRLSQYKKTLKII